MLGSPRLELNSSPSRYIFALATAANRASRNVCLTQKVDPQGNAVEISYDDPFRVIALTDAMGQVTTFSYTDATDPLKIGGPKVNFPGRQSRNL
jgi:YD repeat-containing protein